MAKHVAQREPRVGEIGEDGAVWNGSTWGLDFWPAPGDRVDPGWPMPCRVCGASVQPSMQAVHVTWHQGMAA